MIKNLYLHIGLPKTASTSIQKSLSNSSHVIAGYGFLYPNFFVEKIRVKNHHVPICNLFHADAEIFKYNKRLNLLDTEKIFTQNEKFKKQLYDQIRDFQGENLIISGEFISFLKVCELENLKQFFLETVNKELNFRVIVFIRNPVSYIQSVIQQKVRRGQVLNELISIHQKTSFSSVLSKFINVFSLKNIYLYRFEDALRNHFGPVGGFLSAIGFNKSMIEQISMIHSNKSLSYEAICLISAINEKIPDQRDSNSFKFDKKSCFFCFNSIPGCVFGLAPEQRLNIWSNSEKDLKWINKHFQEIKYEYVEENSFSAEQIWEHPTLDSIDKVLSSQTEAIRDIVCYSIYHELLKYFHEFTLHKIINIIIFLQNADDNSKLNISITGNRLTDHLYLKLLKSITPSNVLFDNKQLVYRILYQPLTNLFKFEPVSNS